MLKLKYKPNKQTNKQKQWILRRLEVCLIDFSSSNPLEESCLALTQAAYIEQFRCLNLRKLVEELLTSAPKVIKTCYITNMINNSQACCAVFKTKVNVIT